MTTLGTISATLSPRSLPPCGGGRISPICHGKSALEIREGGCCSSPGPQDLARLFSRSTARRSVSFTRVCQPRPVPRRYSITSRSIRNVAWTLVGVFCGPRGFGFGKSSILGKTSRAGRKRASCSSVNGGKSTASQSSWEMWAGFLTFLIASSFPLIRLTQADHSNGSATQREDQSVDTAFDRPEGNVSALSISMPTILFDLGFFPSERRGALERDTVLDQIGRSLRRVPFVLHSILSLQFAMLSRAGGKIS